MQMKHLQTILKPDITMLKDILPSYQGPKPTDLSININFEIDKILGFIDNNIAGFVPYYQEVKDSGKENRISDNLVHHFQLCISEQDGFLPYDFRKNPTQAESDKETDIGVYILTRSIKPIPIIEFEAKRFSTTSKYKEYVSGVRGGIERFKRGHHSSHLVVCGMFGYVQSSTSLDWITKVNDLINNLSTTNTDATIDWTDKDEKLVTISSFLKVEKLRSISLRQTPLEKLLLWHYFIDLN